jgi:hypothetical protein
MKERRMAQENWQSADFRMIGPWRITEGSAWRKWQIEALEACRRAAEVSGDEIGVQRFRREIAALEAAPVAPAQPSPAREGR